MCPTGMHRRAQHGVLCSSESVVRWELAPPALHTDSGVSGCRTVSCSRARVAAVWFCVPFAAWPFPELDQDQVCVFISASALSDRWTQHTPLPFQPPPGMVPSGSSQTPDGALGQCSCPGSCPLHGRDPGAGPEQTASPRAAAPLTVS